MIEMLVAPKNSTFYFRVLLDLDEENPSDYINGSYINGYEKEREYIATQHFQHGISPCAQCEGERRIPLRPLFDFGPCGVYHVSF